MNEQELQPGYQKIQRSYLRGGRKKYKVTFNPTSISDKQRLYVKIPKLDETLSIIPYSLALTFEFENKNTKSRFNNKLAACLVNRFQVKSGKDVVYDNLKENTLQLFKDKWWSSGYLSSRIEHGIAPLEVRKNMSQDDSATSGAKTNEVLNSDMAERYKRLRLPLGKIFDHHGVFAPNRLNFDVEYILEFEDAQKIMTAQSSQSVAGYTLDNLQLEYDTIRNSDVANQAFGSYAGRILSFEDVRMELEQLIPKGELMTNLNLHMTRKSLRAIIILFKYDDQIEDEEFIYPNIDKAECTINGVPNAVFSHGMDVSDMHQEAKEYFYHEDKLNAAKFFKDRFAIVWDFRTVRDHTVFNTGVSVDGSHGIQIKLHRRATAKDVTCYCYAVSECLVETNQNDATNIIL